MYKKLNNCPYCGISLGEFKNSGNHVRWCSKNPKHEEYLKQAGSFSKKSYENGRTPWNKGLTNETNESILKGSKTRIDYYKTHEGFFKGKSHTKKTKEIISKKALASKHRRLLKSTRVYAKLNGEQIMLDSSWEELLAKRLDILKIEWIRPKNPLPWKDKKEKNIIISQIFIYPSMIYI